MNRYLSISYDDEDMVLPVTVFDNRNRHMNKRCKRSWPYRDQLNQRMRKKKLLVLLVKYLAAHK